MSGKEEELVPIAQSEQLLSLTHHKGCKTYKTAWLSVNVCSLPEKEFTNLFDMITLAGMPQISPTPTKCHSNSLPV